jgi:hypothetical protein
MRERLASGLAGALGLVALGLPSARAAGPCTSAVAIVSTEWSRDSGDLPVQGVVTRVRFPRSLVLSKGGGRPSDAVDNSSGVKGALFNAGLEDTDRDGVDDLLNIGLVGSDVPSGRFAEVRFECRGDAPPAETEFSCTLEAATYAGTKPGSCRVRWK